MAMNWTHEADVKLLTGILTICDVNLTDEVLSKLSEHMGPECNSMALKNRIAYLKFMANNVDDSPAKAKGIEAKGDDEKPKKQAGGERATVPVGSDVEPGEEDCEELYFIKLEDICSGFRFLKSFSTGERSLTDRQTFF